MNIALLCGLIIAFIILTILPLVLFVNYLRLKRKNKRIVEGEKEKQKTIIIDEEE